MELKKEIIQFIIKPENYKKLEIIRMVKKMEKLYGIMKQGKKILYTRIKMVNLMDQQKNFLKKEF